MEGDAANNHLIEEVRESVTDIVNDDPHLRFFCNDANILRFLRARSMDPKKAAVMLSDTLKWRKEEKVHEICLKDVEPYSIKGKVIHGPVPSKGERPVLILRPRFEDNKGDPELAVKHFAYQMELITRKADKESPDGKIVVLVDFTGYGNKNKSPLKISLRILKMLQYYYPERLSVAIMWHPPTLFSAVFALIKPFIDPVSARKILFLSKGDKTAQSQLDEIIDTKLLDSTCGGSTDNIFDVEKAHARYLAMEKDYRHAYEAFSSNKSANDFTPEPPLVTVD